MATRAKVTDISGQRVGPEASKTKQVEARSHLDASEDNVEAKCCTRGAISEIVGPCGLDLTYQIGGVGEALGQNVEKK